MALTPLLVDAKKEYMHQLADVLMPYVMNTIARIYDTSKKNEKVFREMLRQVPNWNAQNIDERTHEIERRNPQLQDLIAACCVSYTKVLGSIRLNQSQNSNVRVSLPQSSTFVHGVYIHVAKEFFYDPKLVYATRSVKMNLMRDAVDESTRQHVPISQLLKAYLSVAVDDAGLDPIAASSDFSPVAARSPVMQTPGVQSPVVQQLLEQQRLEDQLQQLLHQEQQQQEPMVMQQPVYIQQPMQPMQPMPQPQQQPVYMQQPMQAVQQAPPQQVQQVQVPQQQQPGEVDFFGDDTADFH